MRLATEDDLYWLAEQLYHLRSQTAWANHDMPEYTVGSLVEFLLTKFDDSSSAIFIEDQSVCGVSLGHFIYPPYYRHVTEWLWAGEDKKSTARCLQAGFEWGKQRGAVFGGYVLATPGTSTDFVEEHWVWRKL